MRLKAQDAVRALVDFARSHGVATILVGKSRRSALVEAPRWVTRDRLLREAREFDLYLVAEEDRGSVRLRTRILLAQAPLVLALLFVVWSAWRLARVPAGPILEARAEGLETATVVAAAVAFILGAVASVRLTNAILRPLSILGQATRRIAEGDLEARLVLSGSGEVRALVRDFNAMASRLCALQRSTVGQLEEAQRRARAAIDSLPDPVVVFGLDGGVLEANDAAESLLGVSIDSHPAQAVAAVAPALREALERARSHVLAGKGALVPRGPADAVEVAAQGGPRFCQMRAHPLYDARGSVEAVSVVLVDVTKARHIDELRDDVVATAAHELKTPLTSLRMAIHLCIEGAAGPLRPTQSDLMHSAREDCERIQALVDDILDLARIQSGRTELELVADTGREPGGSGRGCTQADGHRAGRWSASRSVARWPLGVRRSAEAGARARQLRRQRAAPHACRWRGRRSVLGRG